MCWVRPAAMVVLVEAAAGPNGYSDVICKARSRRATRAVGWAKSRLRASRTKVMRESRNGQSLSIARLARIQILLRFVEDRRP